MRIKEKKEVTEPKQKARVQSQNKLKKKDEFQAVQILGVKINNYILLLTWARQKQNILKYDREGEKGGKN